MRMRRFHTGVAALLVGSLSLAACGGGGGGMMSTAAGPLQADSNTSAAQRSASTTIDASTMRAIEHPAYEGPETAALVSLVRAKVKHVFVIIQENHTFDQYFGLYPGTNGQSVENLGTPLAQQNDCQQDPVAGGCQRPFLISANPNSPNYVPDAPDIDGGDNSRYGQEAGIDHGKMDGYLAEDESGQAPLGPTPSPSQIEEHNEDIAIEGVYDCDTIPYL
jgi:phospholipase C